MNIVSIFKKLIIFHRVRLDLLLFEIVNNVHQGQPILPRLQRCIASCIGPLWQLASRLASTATSAGEKSGLLLPFFLYFPQDTVIPDLSLALVESLQQLAIIQRLLATHQILVDGIEPADHFV